SDDTEKFLQELSIPFERLHGSRDYFQFTYESILFEIVPVININDYKLAKNITDCSPLHVRWFQHYSDKIVDDMTLYNHARALKLFCKAQYVYGAESYINGVSGHVIDILTIY